MQKSSVSRNRDSLILSIAALAIVAVLGGIFLGIPAFQAVILSWKDYRPIQGLLGSPWVGPANYQQLFSSPFFPQVVGNSLILGILGNLLPVLAGGALGFVLGRKAAGRKSAAFLACWLLPLFLPEILYAFLAIFGLGVECLTVPGQARLVYLAVSGFRVFCFTVFLSGICGILGKRRGNSAAKASLLGTGAVFALALARALSSSPMLSLFQTPSNYETMDTLDTYIYRIGLMNGEYSFSAATWFTKWLMQLPFLVIGAVLLAVLMKRHRTQLPASSEKSGMAPALAGGVIAVGITLALWIGLLTIRSGSLPADMWMRPLRNSVLGTALAGALFGVIMALFLLSCRQMPTVSMLLGLLLGSFCGNTVATYLFYKQLTLVNTFLGPALWGCWNGVMLFVPLAVAVSMLNGQKAPLSRWIRQMLPFFLLFLGLFLTGVWGGWWEEMVLTSDSQRQVLPLLLREWMNSGMAVQYAESGRNLGVANVLLLSSLVPLLIGAASIVLFGFLFPKEETAS